MTDPKARAEVLKKIERILYDDAAIVPLHWQHLSWAARKNASISSRCSTSSTSPISATW